MKQLTEKFRLVLADDDIDDCEMFQLALERITTNFTLDIVNNGKQLLEHLKGTDKELPHIIFLDLNMPIMNGFETLREIRRDDKLRGLSVALYSTSNNERDIEEALVTGANVYITKPPTFNQLQEILRKVLEINWQFHNSRLNKDTFYLVL